MKRIVEQGWRAVGKYCRSATPDELIVMPNHVHRIIWIAARRGVGAQHARRGVFPPIQTETSNNGQVAASWRAAPLQQPVIAPPIVPGSLASIVRAFKSATAKRVNDIRGTPGAPVWQRNYYERIVRDEEDLLRIRRYIRDNPARWAEDENNLANLGRSP